MNEIEELRLRVETLENFIREFAKPTAIGHEQLWEMVCREVLDMPVPSGIDLRDIVKEYPELTGLPGLYEVE